MLIKEDRDLSNWGIIFIMLIVVVSIIVGMGLGNKRRRGQHPHVLQLSRQAMEGFEPTPEWSNYQSLPALPIPDMANCVRFLGTPPAPVAFPLSKNPYFPAIDWSVSFWVKFDTLETTQSFPLMRKGTISQNGTPSILFERQPYGSSKKPCIVFTYKIKNPLSKNYFGNDYATVCPGVTPLTKGKWKFIAWVQRGPEMSLYEDGKIIYYSQTAPLEMSPGSLRFSPGRRHPSTLRNVTVCRGAKTPDEIANMYQNEHPGGNNILTNGFRKLTNSPDSDLTATYVAQRDNIYKLFSMENYENNVQHAGYAMRLGMSPEMKLTNSEELQAARYRAKYDVRKNPMMLSE